MITFRWQKTWHMSLVCGNLEDAKLVCEICDDVETCKMSNFQIKYVMWMLGKCQSCTFFLCFKYFEFVHGFICRMFQMCSWFYASGSSKLYMILCIRYRLSHMYIILCVEYFKLVHSFMCQIFQTWTCDSMPHI